MFCVFYATFVHPLDCEMWENTFKMCKILYIRVNVLDIFMIAYSYGVADSVFS